MMLFSIAMGVGFVGVLLLVYVVGIMFLEGGLNGDPMKVFGRLGRFGSGPKWGMIFLAVYGLLCITMGVIGFIALSYQPVDFFATIISMLVTTVVALVVRGRLSKIRS
jgi:hypothetical protein